MKTIRRDWLIGSLILVLIAGKAWAAPAFMVIDGTGRSVGMLAFSDGGPNNYIMRKVATPTGPRWYGLQADVHGFVSVKSLPIALYTDATCSGTAYIPADNAQFSLVQHVRLINGAVMLSDPNTVATRTILGYSFGGVGCNTAGTPYTAQVATPTFFDMMHYGFVAPFSVVRVP